MSEFEIAINNAQGAIAGAIDSLKAVKLSLDELETMSAVEAGLRSADRVALMSVIRSAEVARDQAIREKDIAERTIEEAGL
tara:strand:- start:27 stop:269 length:243 start_codon:yes stop_codon:yes gene_type:complete